MNNLFSMKITREKKQIEKEEHREEEEVKREQGRETERQRERQRHHLLHSLCCLSTNINDLIHFKLILLNVNVTKQSRPITPLSHYSESWFTGPTHEQ